MLDCYYLLLPKVSGHRVNQMEASLVEICLALWADYGQYYGEKGQIVVYFFNTSKFLKKFV